MRAGSRLGTVLGGLTVSVVATLVVFAAGEVALRAVYAARNALVDAIALPYTVGDRYGPAPPWADGLRLLEPDPHLLWRNRAAVHRRYVDVFAPADSEVERRALLGRFLPSPPPRLRGQPTWDVSLNTRGYRTAEFDPRKRPSALRIVCLGDSWTFGANVDDDETYPRRLAALLRSRFPAADVEVLNLGVMGYSSHQGLQLLQREALALDPDVVVLGFGMNDSSVAGFHDRDVAAAPPPAAWQRLVALAGRLEVVRLLRYAAQRLRHRPESLASLLRAAEAGAGGPDRRAETAEEYARLEAWTRVPLDDYRRNVEEMIARARARGAAVILLFNEVWEGNPYAATLAEVARNRRVPLVNSAALIAGERRRRTLETERALGLAPSSGPSAGTTPDAVDVVFRVSTGGRPVARALYVVGAHPALGDLVPNRVALRDDGTSGDERAGDGVWSHVARLPAGARIPYVYTNSGREGRWEGLDVPDVREVRLTDARAGERRYLPIDTFGRLPLQADAWHTDATGYAIIARAVLDALVEHDVVRRRLTATSASN